MHTDNGQWCPQPDIMIIKMTILMLLRMSGECIVPTEAETVKQCCFSPELDTSVTICYGGDNTQWIRDIVRWVTTLPNREDELL